MALSHRSITFLWSRIPQSEILLIKLLPIISRSSKVINVIEVANNFHSNHKYIGKYDEKRQTVSGARGGGRCGERRAAIALRGKQPAIECENLIQVIFVAPAKESIIFPQRWLLIQIIFSRQTRSYSVYLCNPR